MSLHILEATACITPIVTPNVDCGCWVIISAHHIQQMTSSAGNPDDVCVRITNM